MKLGSMSKVEDSSGTSLNNYVPHLPVVRPEKSSSKVRIVFDASAKSRGELWLNDCVEVGDNLYPDSAGTRLLGLQMCRRLFQNVGFEMGH